MNDCINREALLEKMADYVSSGYADSAEDFEEYSKIVCQMPSVTPKVIEDIKAEIEQHCCITVGTDNEPAMTLYDIFSILDKHIGGDTESFTIDKSVIEDIKAEINEGIERYKNKDKAVMFGFMCALYIIDKHIEGWNE